MFFPPLSVSALLAMSAISSPIFFSIVLNLFRWSVFFPPVMCSSIPLRIPSASNRLCVDTGVIVCSAHFVDFLSYGRIVLRATALTIFTDLLGLCPLDLDIPLASSSVCVGRYRPSYDGCIGNIPVAVGHIRVPRSDTIRKAMSLNVLWASAAFSGQVTDPAPFVTCCIQHVASVASSLFAFELCGAFCLQASFWVFGMQ